MNEILEEEWIQIPDPPLKPRGSLKPYQVVAISNRGRWKKRDGSIEVMELHSSRVHINGRRVRAYIVLAQNFLITVKRPDQDQIDHITHNPMDMFVNDIRNLRWCSKKENGNFEECKMNQRNAKIGSKNPMFGKTISDEHRKRISEAKKKYWMEKRCVNSY